MRTKTLLLIIGIVLIAVFAVLNVDEFTRTSTLNLGFTTMQLPLGLVMLMLLMVVLLLFVVTTLVLHSSNLMENRKHAKLLTTQRELADKAEASRFTELRLYLESQSAVAVQQKRDTIAALEARLAHTEKLVLNRLEQSDNTNAAYWGQHDDALARSRPLNPL
jgi:uncharacterized integral membrane protein